ncbi:hypothetical protein DEA98_13660 [Brucella pseudogrignonensis]|nr:hypothetical protein [Brucella pseudogrignonensis]
MQQFPLMPILNQEPLITERLRMAFPPRTFTIERVPQVLTLTEFERISRASPFIGLARTGMKPASNNGRLMRGEMLWRLILVNKVSSGLEARFKGDAHEIGLDAMIDVSTVIMHGVSFDDQGVTTVTSSNSIIADGYTEDDMAIAQVDFSFSFACPVANTGLLTPDDFKSLGITWITNGTDEPPISETITPEESHA